MSSRNLPRLWVPGGASAPAPSPVLLKCPRDKSLDVSWAQTYCGIWVLQVPRAAKPQFLPYYWQVLRKQNHPRVSSALLCAGEADRSRSLSSRAQLCCCRNPLPLYQCQSKEKPHNREGFQLTSSHALYAKGPWGARWAVGGQQWRESTGMAGEEQKWEQSRDRLFPCSHCRAGPGSKSGTDCAGSAGLQCWQGSPAVKHTAL